MIRPALAVALVAAGCAHQERPRPVECTRDGLVVRLAQFEAAPEAEPIEVEGQPEPIDAVDEYFNGPLEDSEPVLGGGPKKPERQQLVLPARARDAVDQIIDGATLRKRYPDFQEHHLFPRQFRREFARIPIDVDEWTILVDPRKHAQAHGQRDLFGSGGRWNREWDLWLKDFSRKHPRAPDISDAFDKAIEMIAAHQLAPYGLLAPYGCGRVVAHDLYDIVEPAEN